MEAAVDGEEEVAGAAVEDDPQVAVVEIVDSGENSVRIPDLFVVADGSQVLFYAPIVGEGAEVDPTAGGACCAIQVFVPDGEIEGAVSAHAKTGDGAMRPVWDGGVMSIDVGDKLFAYEGFITNRWIDRTVEIPTVVSAVRRYEKDVLFVRLLLQLWSCGWPLGVVAAVTMQEVDDGKTGAVSAGGMTGCFCGGWMDGWLDDDAFNILVHGVAVDENGVDAGCEGFDGEKKEEGEKEFHAEVFETNIRDEE